MAIFRDSEYTDFSCRPGLDAAWERLPVVATFDGLGARWLGPLVDLGHEVWLGDLSQGAWGYLEGCGWSDLIPAGPMLTRAGKPRAEWAKKLAQAARRLGERGGEAGPENDPERWLSWLCLELSEARGYVQGIAERSGWDR